MARFDISQYMTVAQRVDLFWEKHPTGRIHTVLEHFSPQHVVIRAEIYLDRKDDRPVTVDFAEERPETSPVNKISMVENCSTSAIGRALGDLGSEFTGGKRPSAEEMQKVQRHETGQNRQAQATRKAADKAIAQLKKRDWVSEASSITDIDVLRLLWSEAQLAGASPSDLVKVKEYAEALDSGGERAGVDAGVSGKPAKK